MVCLTLSLLIGPAGPYMMTHFFLLVNKRLAVLSRLYQRIESCRIGYLSVCVLVIGLMASPCVMAKERGGVSGKRRSSSLTEASQRRKSKKKEKDLHQFITTKSSTIRLCSISISSTKTFIIL